MKYSRRYCFSLYLLFFLLSSVVAHGNNVRIRGDVRVLSDNITNPGNVATFSFTVEWDNSWRDMFNYDGVYVFLKYKLNKEGEQWHHLYLMDEGNRLSSDGFSMELKNTTASVNKNEGFFLYRSKDNQTTGTSAVKITAKWLINSNPDCPLKISDFIEGKVMLVAMGIEMVYVPRGGFRIGDTYAKHHFRNNYLPFPEKYDVIHSGCIIKSSSPVSPEYPDPRLAINRVNDLSAVKGASGYPSNAWYGDKVGSGLGYQYWSVRFPSPICIKYIAIESVPGYVPNKWKFQGQASADVDSWTDLYTGTADDWETSLTCTYPPTKAFRVNPENKNYIAYRIYVEQSEMPGGSSGNPPLLKNMAMTTTDLSQVIDNSVIVHSPTVLMGWQRGLAADDGDTWAGTTDENYPNGYPAFWAMKYEISQEQYVSFLNRLTADQQRARTTSKIEYFEEGDYIFGPDRKNPSYRNGIYLQRASHNNQPMVFGTDYPTLACNYLSPADMLAYADWTGLRPLSEMEYEKMCRAFYPSEAVRGEYPWNTVSIRKLTGVSDPGTRTEAPLNGEENINLGKAVEGPTRCGAFAVGATGREQTGATFWGVMDCAGNLDEICYNANIEGRMFRGIQANQHGNGKIRINGTADVTEFYWPIHHDAFALKGGSWADTARAVAMISDRTRHWGEYKNMNLERRDSSVTFRLGHTASQHTFPLYLKLQNGLTTENGEVADTVCHADSYRIEGTLPEELKDDLYAVNWFVSENQGVTWDPVEGEGNQSLTLTKLWNINTDEDVIKEYWVKKEIYGLSGDAISEKVILKVLNDSTYLNRLKDTLDIYDHSLAIGVNVSQLADLQWIVGSGQRNIEHVIKEGKREVAAPEYASLEGTDTWYVLRSVFLNHCVSLDTIRTYRLPAPDAKVSTAVTCGEIMIDNRDGKRYRTVEIGNQCWMADNLNYFVTDSRCYEDDFENCDRYGRLYNWTQAVGSWDDDMNRGICPEGWHIPSRNEWIVFQQHATGQSMRSQLNDWLLKDEASMATNGTRFSALPGGGYFFSYHATIGSSQLGVRLGYFDKNEKAWWWASGFTKASYTTRSTAAVAQINIPSYFSVDYKNTQAVGSSGSSTIFYGDTPYLGNSTAINATSQTNAATAVENNFYFNVRCVMDE